MKKNLIFDKDSIAQFSGGYILVDNTALIDMSHEQNSATHAIYRIQDYEVLRRTMAKYAC